MKARELNESRTDEEARKYFFRSKEGKGGEVMEEGSDGEGS